MVAPLLRLLKSRSLSLVALDGVGRVGKPAEKAAGDQHYGRDLDPHTYSTEATGRLRLRRTAYHPKCLRHRRERRRLLYRDSAPLEVRHDVEHLLAEVQRVNPV